MIRVDPATSSRPAVAALVGEVDRSSAPELVRRLGQALDAELVLDVSEVEFLDIGGLRALLELDARLRGTGHRLVLAAASWPVRLVLDHVVLDRPSTRPRPWRRRSPGPRRPACAPRVPIVDEHDLPAPPDHAFGRPGTGVGRPGDAG
jgi:anti-anti-sigma factor